MDENELRQIVIGLAFKVHNALSAGFYEKIYENALRIEIERSGLCVEQQKPISVLYEGEVVGEFFADLFVGGCLMIELKAARSLAEEHAIQLVNYLTATGYDSGLLINFGDRVEVKRKFRIYRKAESCSS